MKILAAFAALSLATPAFADAGVTLPLGGGDASIQSARYACGGGKPFDVQYVNSGPNSLALLMLDGQEIVFVNVIAASGARYVAGTMEFWTKGETASFSDALKDEGKPQDCAQVQ